MTLPELILAISMMTAFTGITVMVTKYTTRFFQPSYEESKSSNKGLKDQFYDHYQINEAFDSIIEILSQPGISKDTIFNLKCTSSPSEWDIPSFDTKPIPKSYKICVSSTPLIESNYEKSDNPPVKPGIYILYAKPENGISVNAIPLRRIFCRPKPFC